MLSHAINHVGEFKAEEGLVDVYVWIIYFFKKGIFINGSNYEHVLPYNTWCECKICIGIRVTRIKLR